MVSTLIHITSRSRNHFWLTLGFALFLLSQCSAPATSTSATSPLLAHSVLSPPEESSKISQATPDVAETPESEPSSPTPISTPTSTPIPTKRPSPTPSPTPDPWLGEDGDPIHGLIRHDIQLREGGGPNHIRTGLITADTPIVLQARQGDWLLIEDTDGFRSGWLPLSTVEVNPSFDLLTLPVLISPPPLSELLMSHSAVTYHPTDMFFGPGFQYTVMGGSIPPSSPLQIVGRDDIGMWLQVEDSFGPSGWVLASSLRFNPTFQLMDLPMTAELYQPDILGSAEDGIWSYDWSTHYFEWGAQSHDMRHSDEMKEMGMQWMKVQHIFHENSQPRDVTGLIRQAHDRGFKILLSITGEPYPTSIDFERYVQFIGGVAALSEPPDGIEIWNEMNIDFEWPAGEINPETYVERMLKPAFVAIKNQNPNILVISGALAPTGFNNGINAWADDRYLAGMVQAQAMGYLDCVGVHYNAGATSPHQNYGHPAGGFYGWYFQPTLQMVIRTTGRIKPICITELGYLTAGDLHSYEMPANFWWAKGTTVDQHARWHKEALDLAQANGSVRLVTIFSADIYHWDGRDPQTGYAIFRPRGNCPACDAFKGR